VRFAKELGYRDFPNLKRNRRKELGPRLRAAMRMNQTIAGIGKTENVLTNLIERDIQLLRSTLESMLAIAGAKKSDSQQLI
jgi:DNA-binding MurR/RpiR family transcriptional regulator